MTQGQGDTRRAAGDHTPSTPARGLFCLKRHCGSYLQQLVFQVAKLYKDSVVIYEKGRQQDSYKCVSVSFLVTLPADI